MEPAPPRACDGALHDGEACRFAGGVGVRRHVRCSS
jgi:hypothetical protein